MVIDGNLDPAKGSETGKIRPCVIVTNNTYNARVPVIHCRQTYGLPEIHDLLQTAFPPTCQSCEGLIKPAVVMFGEALPSESLGEAEAQSSTCDLFLAIGSSLVVQSVASPLVVAKRSGAGLVIVNKDATRLDSMADLVIHGIRGRGAPGEPPFPIRHGTQKGDTMLLVVIFCEN